MPKGNANLVAVKSHYHNIKNTKLSIPYMDAPLKHIEICECSFQCVYYCSTLLSICALDIVPWILYSTLGKKELRISRSCGFKLQLQFSLA